MSDTDNKSPLDMAFEKGRPALVTYLTAGDPTPEGSLAMFQALVEGGADIIEIGVPFSDPGADGPTIQRASERALAAGGGLENALQIAKALPENVAKILFGYLNPFFAFGYEKLAQRCEDAGIHGLLCVDCPPEEEEGFRSALQAHGVAPILLAAPTTPESRIPKIARAGAGFLYYVSMTGVTGTAIDLDGVGERVARVRELANMPVAVGFGIRSEADVRALAPFADGVVVGSELVRIVETLGQGAPESLVEKVRELKRGIC
jgi:tryptophan synthase alpha chain